MCLSAQSPNARAEEIADASQSRTAPIFGAPATAFNSNSKQDFTCRKAPSAILHRQPVQFRIDCGVPCPTFQRYWLLRFSLRRLPGVSCCSRGCSTEALLRSPCGEQASLPPRSRRRLSLSLAVQSLTFGRSLSETRFWLRLTGFSGAERASSRARRPRPFCHAGGTALASGVLHLSHLCAAAGPGRRDGGNWHFLYATCSLRTLARTRR